MTEFQRYAAYREGDAEGKERGDGERIREVDRQEYRIGKLYGAAFVAPY